MRYYQSLVFEQTSGSVRTMMRSWLIFNVSVDKKVRSEIFFMFDNNWEMPAIWWLITYLQMLRPKSNMNFLTFFFKSST